MSLRLTSLLALVCAVLMLLVVFSDRDDDSAVHERLEQTRRAFRFDPARIQGLIIETGNTTIECRHDGTRWHIVRPIAARADSGVIARLLGTLQELPRGDLLLPPQRTGNPYEPYGLDMPRATVSLLAGAHTNRIQIGRSTALGDGVYVRQSEQAGIVRLHPGLLDALPQSADALRDRSLLEGTTAAISRLDIRGPSGYLQLARENNNGWRIHQPFAARADSATISALIEKLLSCSVVHFIQDRAGDLAPYGLDSQSAVSAVLNTDSGEASQVIALGDPLPNDPTLVYARLQAETSIVAVPHEIRQALLIAPDDLRDRRLPALDLDKLATLRITSNSERTLEFQHDADYNSWNITAPIRSAADLSSIRELQAIWADMRLTTYESPDIPAPAIWKREITLTPRSAQAPSVQVRIAPHPSDTNLCHIFIAGETRVAIATPARLLDFALDPNPYRTRNILELSTADVVGIRVSTRSTQSHGFSRDKTGPSWNNAPPWLEPLLATLCTLQADTILASDAPIPADAFDTPHLTLTIRMSGTSGIATTLIIGTEVHPNGPRLATLRGRDITFTLAPWIVATLTPPETP